MRILIIGLDGLFLESFDSPYLRAAMPFLTSLSDEHDLRPLASAPPYNSAAAWVSAFTGVNPGKHGIYDFATINATTQQTVLNSFMNVSFFPFWNALSLWDKKCQVWNVPMTYPLVAPGINMVAGFPIPNSPRLCSIWPPYIHPLNLHSLCDVDLCDSPEYNENFQRSKYLYKFQTLSIRQRNFLTNWLKTDDIDVTFLAFLTPDRLFHHFWDCIDAFDSSSSLQPLRVKIGSIFSQLDATVQQIFQDIIKPDAWIVFSDHGLGPEQYRVSLQHVLNIWFQQCGKSIRALRSILQIYPGHGSEAGIHIHLQDKEADRIERYSRVKNIISDLRTTFMELKGSDGKSVIRDVLSRENCWSGPELTKAPSAFIDAIDLGTALRRCIEGKQVVYSGRPWAGCHRSTGLLLTNILRNSQTVSDFTVCDIPALVFKALDLDLDTRWDVSKFFASNSRIEYPLPIRGSS